MKASDYIVQYFHEKGVNLFFGYIGGMITHLVDAVSQNPNTQFIQTYHEQTAAIAAEGYARANNTIGVAMSTSGPGVTNMMTGIANAYFDSIPVIYLTGQVNTHEYKYDKPIRQQGFQEMDVVQVVQPIVKYTKLIDKVDELRYELEKAYYMATQGRPGPVVLDIPMDIQRMEIDPLSLKSYHPIAGISLSNDFDLNAVIALMSNAKRPILLIGGGVKQANKALLDEFLKKYNYPLVTSLMGIGIMEDIPNFMGMIGSYGNRCANMTIANADLVIALGTRLDTRQTGAKLDGFVRQGTIIHVDIDKNELTQHRLKNRLTIWSTAENFLLKLNAIELNVCDIGEWTAYVHQLKANYNQTKEVARFVDNKSPYRFLQCLNKYTKEGDVFCVDIGQNQMWAAQTLLMKPAQRFFTSGGLAPMGYALSAAVGAAFANRNKTVFAICGDGGFHIATQALMLIKQYDLPILVLVINNQSLGMITQFQELYFENRLSGTASTGGYLSPNVQGLAQAYGLDYTLLNQQDLLDDTKLVCFGKRNGIIEFTTEGFTKVSPKLEFDKNIERLSPLLPDKELADNMLIGIIDNVKELK